MATVDLTATPPAGRTRRRSLFFVGAALPLIAIALAGFWPQYYGRLLSGTPLDPKLQTALVHLHSSLFLGWLAILLLQSGLVRSNRTAAHRQLGPILALYGYGAAAVGVLAGLVLAARQVRFGGTVDAAATLLAAPLLDMAVFLIFLTGAIRYRARPEVHKRLMLLSAYCFAFVGFVRLLARAPGLAGDLTMLTLLLLLPILLAAGLDWAIRRKLHPVWGIGLAIFGGRLLLELAADSDGWRRIGRVLLQPFL